MHSVRRILSVLLCAVLLCTVAAPAFAETTYLTLQTLLSTADYESVYLGTPAVYLYDEAQEDIVMLCYRVDTKEAALIGLGQDADKQITIWSEVEPSKALITIYNLCSIWETLTADLPENMTLSLGIVDSDNSLWVSDAETAQSFMAALSEMASGAESTAE